MSIESATQEAQEHFQRALDMLQSEDYESAAGEALLASKANKAPFPEAELLAAHAYYGGAGSGGDFLNQLEKVVKLDPSDAGSWLLLALQARSVRESLFELAVEQKDLGTHRKADKYFKMSQHAFQEARSRYPSFLNSSAQAHALSFLLGYDLPIQAGDFIAKSDTMPIKDALAWYQIAADYNIEAILAKMKASGAYTEEEDLARLRTELEEVKATANRKQALLENSATAKKPRNKGMERTMNQKLLINAAILLVFLLFICWGLYALIT